jgi:hypothetical protein
VGGSSHPRGLHSCLVITPVETVDGAPSRRSHGIRPVDDVSMAKGVSGDGAWTGTRRAPGRPWLFTSRLPRLHSRTGSVHRRPQGCPRPVVPTPRRPLTVFVHKVVPTLCTKRGRPIRRVPVVPARLPTVIAPGPMPGSAGDGRHVPSCSPRRNISNGENAQVERPAARPVPASVAGAQREAARLGFTAGRVLRERPGHAPAALPHRPGPARRRALPDGRRGRPAGHPAASRAVGLRRRTGGVRCHGQPREVCLIRFVSSVTWL